MTIRVGLLNYLLKQCKKGILFFYSVVIYNTQINHISYNLDVRFDFEALPTVMFFRKGDAKGALYEGAFENAKINEFENDGLGRDVERTEVNNTCYHETIYWNIILQFF